MITSLQDSWQIQICVIIFTPTSYNGHFRIFGWRWPEMIFQLQKSSTNGESGLIISSSKSGGALCNYCEPRLDPLPQPPLRYKTWACQRSWPYGWQSVISTIVKPRRSWDSSKSRKLPIKSKGCASIHIIADKLRPCPWFHGYPHKITSNTFSIEERHSDVRHD